MAIPILTPCAQRVAIRLATLVLILAALAAPSHTAFGQGTSGILPNPITTHELKGYADRLRLSDQQRQAAEAIHDQYKRDFRALRQGEIATFLKEMRSMQGNVMPKRDVMDAFMKKMDMLNGRIATLDSRMFDQLQTILTDEQMAMMPRVRMARQRARYADNQMMWMTGNRGVDLSDVVGKLDLNAEELQTIDPTLNQYEGKLTSSMTKLYDATTGMMTKMFDAMEEMGFVEQDLSNPENAQKFGEAMQQIWRDLTLQAVEAAAGITELNQRTYRSISSNLPPEKARELRNSYYSQAFPEAAFALSNETARFDEALKIESLTPEQRDVISAARYDLQQKMDRIVEDTVKMIEHHRAEFSPFDFNSEKMQEYSRNLQDYGVKVTDARKAATDLLNSTLGEELAKKVEKSAMAQAGDKGGLGAMMRAAMEKAEAARAENAAAETGDPSDASAYMDDAQSIQQAWTGDQFVAGPIGKPDINRYAAILGIGDDRKPLLTQVHATYLENFKKVQENEISELTKALQSMWKFNIETQTTSSPTIESVEATQKARRTAIEAVARADDAFFNDVQLALLDEGSAKALERVRLMRQRDCWNRGTEGMWAFASRGGENRIELASFLHRQPITDDDRAAIDADVWAYEQAATPLFHARFDASIAIQKAQDMWQIEMATARNDGENNQFKIAARYQELLGDASKSVTDASSAIVKLNRDWLAKIIAKLPADTAVTVQNAYNRMAFPSVYNDQLALENHFKEAAKLPDIGPEQQRRITDLAAEYRPAYAHLCDQMTEIASGTESPSFAPGADPDAWKQWQEKREALANIRFDRDELCLRTMSQLKAILSEDQLRRIGGLPQPKKREAYEEWMD